MCNSRSTNRSGYNDHSGHWTCIGTATKHGTGKDAKWTVDEACMCTHGRQKQPKAKHPEADRDPCPAGSKTDSRKTSSEFDTSSSAGNPEVRDWNPEKELTQVKRWIAGNVLKEQYVPLEECTPKERELAESRNERRQVRSARQAEIDRLVVLESQDEAAQEKIEEEINKGTFDWWLGSVGDSAYPSQGS
jgi:hypothetical protein